MKAFAYVPLCLLLVLTFSFTATSVEQKTSEMPDPHSAIFAQNCVKCHDLTRVEAAHKTKTKLEMRDIIEKMQKKPDSGITDKEAEELKFRY